MTEFTAPVRAAAYVAGLAVVLVAAFGVGRLAGPVDAEADPAPEHSMSAETPGVGPADPLADVLSASVDGYDVILNRDEELGPDIRLVATVARDGRPVTDLERSAGGELGHLMTIGDGATATADAAAEAPGAGPDLVFDVTFPRTGQYRTLVEFHHDGAPHTAEFMVSVLVP